MNLDRLRTLNPIPVVKSELGIGHTKLYALIRDGDLVAVKIGRATRITGESVEAYYSRLVAASKAEEPSKAA